MTSNALIFCAAFCFASFVWGMVRHFRRLGRPSRAMLMTAFAAAVFAICQLAVLVRRPHRFALDALVLYGASATLFWWAVRVSHGKLAACGQGAVSTHVVGTGPWRYVRHPFYLSYNLTWFAGLVATAWWPLAVSAITMAALYEHFAREEERGFLKSSLALEYREYRRRAGKYLPRIVAWSQESE
jgi:protein-S-isoprenylcysteine O-methyltransferase Ste14